MPSGHSLDIEDVHRALWARADRRGGLHLNQKDVAAELGVNKFTLSRKTQQLIDEGRIRRVGTNAKKNARGVFMVVDPDEYVPLETTAPVPASPMSSIAEAWWDEDDWDDGDD